MSYGLPKSVEIDGRDFAIRYDFRVILSIFEVLNDTELSDQERAFEALTIFYPEFDEIQDLDTASRWLFWFINRGEKIQKKKQRDLVDWQKDFNIIVAPVNRVIGYETRAVGYDPITNTGGLHWWTWMAAYMEIGDCLFAQVVGIRSKLAQNKPLDKSDREFYRNNRELVDIETKYTPDEDAFISRLIGG